MMPTTLHILFFFFNDTATTEIYTLSLHDALPISNLASTYRNQGRWKEAEELFVQVMETRKRVLGAEHPDMLISMNNLASTDRKSTRLNSSHLVISYAVFCLKKKKEYTIARSERVR